MVTNCFQGLDVNCDGVIDRRDLVEWGRRAMARLRENDDQLVFEAAATSGKKGAAESPLQPLEIDAMLYNFGSLRRKV